MPRYYPREHMRRDDSGLEDLLALSQIMQTFQAPQQRQQETGQQNALAILGMAMQAQQQEAQNQFRYKELGSQDEYHRSALAQQKAAQDSAEGHYWGGDYANQREQMEREAELKQKALMLQQAGFDDQVAHNRAVEALQERQLTQQGDQDQSQTLRVLASGLFSNPNINPTDALGMIGAMGYDPANAAVQAAHGRAMQSGTSKLAPVLQGLYQTNRNNLPELNSALAAIQSTTPADYFNNQDWDALNAALPEGVPISSNTSNIGGQIADYIPRLWNSTVVPGSNRMKKMLFGGEDLVPPSRMVSSYFK